MKISGQQITARGIAQQSGLESFSSIITYDGEYVNFGNAYDYGTQLALDTNYATETATPHIGALVGSPPTLTNQWYRYFSSGALYTQPTAAISMGYFNLSAIETGGLPSYCGIYQKLSLTSNKEYKISVRTLSNALNDGIGTIYINTYTPSSGSFLLTSTKSKTLPNTIGHLGAVESEFIALSSNDILLIYFTTTETSVQQAIMSSISIAEKQEYLTSVYANDMFGNAHKVLRVAADQIIPTDET